MVGIRAEGGLAPLRAWSLVSRIVIGIYLALIVLLLLSVSVILYNEVKVGYSTFRVMQPAFALWLAIGFVISAAPVIVWIHRAHANLRDDGLAELNYSPAWAVGSFFVPFVNLIVPKRAMRELANRSAGEEAAFADSDVGDVSSWWTCLIAGSIIQLYLDFAIALDILTNVAITAPPGVNTFLAAFSILLLGGSAVFLFRIVASVTRDQHSVTSVGDTFA